MTDSLQKNLQGGGQARGEVNEKKGVRRKLPARLYTTVIRSNNEQGGPECGVTGMGRGRRGKAKKSHSSLKGPLKKTEMGTVRRYRPSWAR